MDSHNMSWIRYPSHVSPAVEDVIAAQSVISRCMHVYVALFVPLSLVTGLFNLITFIRGHRRLGALDMLLSGLTVTSVLATLLSLSVASRPDYIPTTNLQCGVLSFFSNMCYFNAQYLQGAMLVLSLLPGSSGYLLTGAQDTRKPLASLAAICGCAICSSLVVVALLGTSRELHKPTMCQADPLTAWPEYEIVKFSLGFGFGLILKLVLLLLLTTKLAWRTALTRRDTASALWVVLAITLNMFACRLFFNTVLLQRARRKMQRDTGSPQDELLMNLAELVLSGESCVNSLATLALHKPCRLTLLDALGRLTQRCRRGGSDNSVSLNRMGAGSDPACWHAPQGK
ncbi:G protein-coupled receptor 146 [Sciurus carolinensis]|uniref:G protein-coupled receptor 146 n=1 Tax=Sciurus carolinensis TaxID=30640 RepID=A0AA41T4E9_SCICA|nr:uncharacterized protein LOC124969819 [Sciurus carolinensis]MBZ3883500.1 G protein-coupled receptor 146 [Sciurus carolinensis]